MEFDFVKHVVDEDGNPVNRLFEVSINGTKLVVPKVPGNRHYDAIQEWIAEGNTPLPADSE